MTTTVPEWPAKSSADFIEQLFSWLKIEGKTHYDDSVNQLEHALQTAYLAERARDADSAVAAALLHDVGHLLVVEHTRRTDFLEADERHEQCGANWLAQMFPRDVSEPVRGHVIAKRFLCAVDRDYYHRLSDASKRSLELQGGPLSDEQVLEADASPLLQVAVRLRQRDDAAKSPGRKVPPLEHYRPLLESLIVR